MVTPYESAPVDKKSFGGSTNERFQANWAPGPKKCVCDDVYGFWKVSAAAQEARKISGNGVIGDK